MMMGPVEMQNAEQAAERSADRVVQLEDELEDEQRRSSRALHDRERCGGLRAP